MNIRSSGGNIKLKMCRKVEIFDKRMVLGVVVPQIVPQMMQFKQFHQYQIDMNEGGRIVVQFKYEQSIQDAVRALHTD